MRAHPTDVVLPRLGPLGWLRWAWRQLTSMRTALLLLLLLAVAAVPGSVFPQRRVDSSRVLAYLADHPASGRWLDRLGAFDVYASPWFSAVYLLLFVSLVGCIVPRSRNHWRAARAAPPRTPRRLAHLPVHSRALVAAAPEQVLQTARGHLRRRRYRLAGHDGGASLAAERGYLAETGNLLFHLALLGVLSAVALGSLFSWTGQAIVVVGKGFSDTLPQYDSFRPGSRVDTGDLPPFSLSLDGLRVKFEEQASGSQFAAPRDFEADVTVRDSPDAAPARRTLRVNHPLDVDGARVYLVGNGYAPVVTVRDATRRVVFTGPVPFAPRDAYYTSLGVIKAYDAQPKEIGLTGFLLPTAFLDPRTGPVSVFPDARSPRLVLTAFVGDLGGDDGVPQSVYTLDTSRMTQLRGDDGPLRIMLAPGQGVTMPDGAGSVSFDGLRRFAALDVHHDPSKAWALGSAAMALCGLLPTLFVRRRRVWVRTGSDARGRTVVEVAGLARGEDDGLAAEIAALLDVLAADDADGDDGGQDGGGQDGGGQDGSAQDGRAQDGRAQDGGEAAAETSAASVRE